VAKAFVAIVTICVLMSCARGPGAESPTPASGAPAAAPVLRLLDITPRDGARVDSGTVIMARLAYHIPDFDSDRIYTVSAVFAGVEGGMFSRGGRHGQIGSPLGIVTVRHALERLWERGANEPAMPLTGSFHLLESGSVPAAVDTLRVEGQTRIRVGRISTVRARSRTFFFNGTGPTRSMGARFPEVMEEYWVYRLHKALAVAYETASRWTYGYASGYPSPEDAAGRALEECRAAAELREIDAPCRLVVVDDQEPEQ
jgi:hypothetical protein